MSLAFGDSSPAQSGLHSDLMDDLGYMIDRLNSTDRFRVVMRGGVFGPATRLWNDLTQAPPNATQFLPSTDTRGGPTPQTSHKLTALPMPSDLRNQLSLMNLHLSMGLLRPPLDRAWIAIDDYLFLWDMSDDDVAFFDLHCVTLDVNYFEPPASARHPKHHDVTYFLAVIGSNEIKVFELAIHPNVCVLFSAPDSTEPMYSFKTTDSMISAACVGPDGRFFYGVRDGRIFELTFKYSSFWGCTCKSTELTGFGPGVLKNFMPMFFASSCEDQVRQVEQLCLADSGLLIVRRKTQIQCAQLNSAWSLQSVARVSSLNVRAVNVTPLPSTAEEARKGQLYLFVVTDRGSRMILDATNGLQIVIESPVFWEIGQCSSAFVDPHTCLCLVQRQDDAAILYSDSSGSFQRLLDEGMLWGFSKHNHCQMLTHSRYCRPNMEFLLLMTNHAVVWNIPGSHLTDLTALSSQEMLISLADVLYPYWNSPLAEFYHTSQASGDPPIVSRIDATECQAIATALNNLSQLCHAAKAVELARLIRDVFVCWQLVSGEHQLHAVVEHVSQQVRHNLVEFQLKSMCSPDGRQVITSLLNGLIQLYLDDRAATDALLARLKQLNPTFFSPEAALLAQASELLQKAASGRSIVDSCAAKEAVGLLLRAAGSVDLELWGPAMIRLGLITEVVSLTILIALRHVDPQNLGLYHYLNRLSAEEDPEGEQLMRRRVKLYDTMLDAAKEDELDELETELLRHQDDQLAHVVLFDRKMTADSMDYQRRERLSDWMLTKLGQSQYLEGYLQRCSDEETIRVFALRSLCRLYEMRKEYMAASSALTRLALLPDQALAIEERLAFLSKALLSLKNYPMKKQTTDKAIELENYIEIAQIQLKVADRIRGTADEATVRYSSILDLTTLYRLYAEPHELLDCQLALLAMASHNDPQLVNDLWIRICKSCPADGSTVRGALELLPCGAEDQRYAPLPLIIQLLEERAVELSPAVRCPGWSLELLSDYVRSPHLLLKAAEGYFEEGGVDFIDAVVEYASATCDSTAVSQLIVVVKRLLAEEQCKDIKERAEKSLSQDRLRSIMRLLEQSKQHLMFV